MALENATTPAAPSLLSPSGTIGDNRPAFRCNVPSGAPSLYQLRVQRSDGATAHDDAYAPGICDSSKCSTTLPSSLEIGDYTWQVRAENDVGWGDWSTASSFTIEGYSSLPSAPVAVSPTGTMSESPSAFVWSPLSNQGVTRYQLSVFQPGGDQVYEGFLEASSCTDVTCSLIPQATFPDGSYSWDLRGLNALGWGDWSTGMAFAINSDGGGGGGSTSPEAPTLLSPKGTIKDRRPTFVWSDVAGADGYRVQVRLRGGGIVKNTKYRASATCSNGQCSLPAWGELAHGRYVWRVMASNDAGRSRWSKKQRFRVK